MSDGEGLEATYLGELARSAGGALLFAFPLLMTMEMWWFGFSIDGGRLALFLVVGLVLLVGLAARVGFHAGRTRLHDVLDALSSFGVGAAVSALMLIVFGVIDLETTAIEAAGMIAVQTVPAGIGAVLARKQLKAATQEDDDDEAEEPPPATYGGELFVMFGGAVFVAFNVAPTDEVARIADLATPWHGLALALLSLALLHVLVYRVEFAGQEPWPEGQGFAGVFVRYALAGYGVALAVSLYILWTFGRLEGNGLGEVLMLTTILGFPASLGAATARLVI
jgi:putative integral membrane protein (TIGR02587 family)